MQTYQSQGHFLSPSQSYARAHAKRVKFTKAFRDWARTAFRRWERRRMIAALQSMDDRVLRDIGIRRSEIPSVVRGFTDEELG